MRMGRLADIYMRQGTTTTLITPGTTAVVTFDGISNDGSRVFFHTVQQLIDDTDGASDIYQAQAGAYTLLTPGTPIHGPDLQGQLRRRKSRLLRDARRSTATGASTSTAPRAER